MEFKIFKKYSFISCLGLLGLTLISGKLNGKINFVQDADVDSEEIRSIIVEGWETDNWEIKAIPGAPEGTASTKLVSGFPKNLGSNTKNKRSLGLRYNFVYPGHNSIILTPPKEKAIRRPTGQLDANNQPIYVNIPGIELPGKIEGLSVWVLGRGNNGFLEAWVQDWRGDTHVLKMGSINFVGWRPLMAKVPTWVPQNTTSFPQNRSMIFKKFIIRSDPNAPSEEIIMFLDSFKILSNIYDLYFDGVEVNYDQKDKETKENLTKHSRKLINEFSD